MTIGGGERRADRPETAGEAVRLASLHGLRILDTAPEAHLDAVCRTAAALFRAPTAVIALVDEARVWFKARHGAAPACIDRAGAFCDHTIRGRPGEALVVPDLARDPRFASSPLVAGALSLRFYAGVPFAARSGENVGTLCVVDTVPRADFGPEEVGRLQDLALIVQAHLRLHEAHLSHEAEIAERRSVERRLQAARESQAIAERTARFGHWRVAVAERTVAWSEGLARIFGHPLPAEPLPLDRHLEVYHPEDRARVRERIEGACEGRSRLEGGGYEHVSRVVRPDGAVRYVSVYGIAERDDDGRVAALHGVCLDVTEHVRAERSQREANDLLRATVEAMGQGLLVLGPDERVRLHNRRAHDLLGLPDDLLYDGAPFEAIRRHQLATGEFDRASPRLRRRVEAGGLEKRARVYERERPDGTILEIRAVPMQDGGVVRTLTDVTRRRESERAVQASEQRYRLLAEHTTDIIIWSDLQTTRRYVSPAIRTVLGYDPESLIGTRPLSFVHPDDAERYGRVLADLTSERMEEVTTTQRYRHADGHWLWIEVSFKLTRDPDTGAATGYVASLRDVTDRKAAEDALRLSEERLAHALDSGDDGLWDWDVATGATWFSDRWQTMLGYEPGEIEGHVSAWERIAHPDDVPTAFRLLTDHFEGRTPVYECEHRVRTKAGPYTWVLARGKVVSRDAAGAPLRIVGTHIDIAARKEAERQIAHMAAHDALTGLPNRLLFRDRLDHELADARSHGGGFAVLACDLDRFKAVNDTHGHPAGDRLLRTIAERLTAAVRDVDTVARLGGDEFAIILSRIEGPAAAALAAQRVIEAVGEPVDLDGDATGIGVSVGIALGSGACEDPDSLFRNADIALYRAKAAGRNTYSFYEPGMDAAVAARNQLERDLREAVREGALSLHYQPIVRLGGGVAGEAVCGFEALLRWNHPRRGPVSPAEFVPLAEETGLIVPLGAWALREACREAALWPDGLRVAVNVSAVQFQKPGLEQAVVAALAASGLAPGRLELEITESVLMEDAEGAVACLRRLHGLGVRVALDDFGTGYSSLSYLRRFPFDKIKIDRSFVRDVCDPDTAAIVRAIVGIGERLGSAITAEGVETDEQLERVRREGCTEVQGYLYSRPLPAADALAFARAGRRQAA